MRRNSIDRTTDFPDPMTRDPQTNQDEASLEFFFRTRDDSAFTKIVQQHLGLVHAVAFRITRENSLAEEVAQNVFIKLAGIRGSLPKNLPLVVWLHRTSHSASLDLLRSEKRRRKREATATALNLPMNEPSPSSSWDRISPLLDEVIGNLPVRDRQIVLNRYIQGRSWSDIARASGESEDAIRMRGNRALVRMRDWLGQRGITTTATALGLVLPAQALFPASVQTVSSVARAALAGANAPGIWSAGALKSAMAAHGWTIAAGGSLLALATIGIYAVLEVSSQPPAPVAGSFMAPATRTAVRPVSASAPVSAARAVPGLRSPGQTAQEDGRDEHDPELRLLQRRQQIDSRLFALRNRLNLTPGEEEEIRAVLTAGDAQRDVIHLAEADRRREGGDTVEAQQQDRTRFRENLATQEAAILALLSEEQAEAYQRYCDGWMADRRQEWATQQAGALRDQVDLTPPQQEAAAALFSQQAGGFDPLIALSEGGQVLKSFDEQSDAAGLGIQQSLQSILTPAQWELYQTQLEQRAALP
ncbi:MAG: sigE 1, partial [Akkermansiaceae bacterium]|nr:sigE 1 [Akkermansiaceae bacterium]